MTSEKVKDEGFENTSSPHSGENEKKKYSEMRTHMKFLQGLILYSFNNYNFFSFIINLNYYNINNH